MRAPLDYAYTAIDIMAALPRSEAVDVDALPADLQRKARAHGDDLDNIVESEQLTTRHRRDIAWTEIARAGRFVEPIAKYRAPATAGIAVVLMVGHWWRHSGASVVEILAASNPFGYLAIALGAAALLVRFARRRAATAPHWVYTADELATLDAASIDWPAVPEELDRYANGEALRREWHNRWMSRIHPGGAALVWREPHLVAVATLLGRDIRSSPGNSELLDIHRVRIDLDQTLDGIYSRAHRIWRARANLVPPPSKDPADVVARRNAEMSDAAADAWNTLVALVCQLQDYRKPLPRSTRSSPRFARCSRAACASPMTPCVNCTSTPPATPCTPARSARPLPNLPTSTPTLRRGWRPCAKASPPRPTDLSCVRHSAPHQNGSAP